MPQAKQALPTWRGEYKLFGHPVVRIEFDGIREHADVVMGKIQNHFGGLLEWLKFVEDGERQPEEK